MIRDFSYEHQNIFTHWNGYTVNLCFDYVSVWWHCQLLCFSWSNQKCTEKKRMCFLAPDVLWEARKNSIITSALTARTWHYLLAQSLGRWTPLPEVPCSIPGTDTWQYYCNFQVLSLDCSTETHFVWLQAHWCFTTPLIVPQWGGEGGECEKKQIRSRVIYLLK